VKISAISGKEFINLGLKDYPGCGTPLEVLEFHNLDGKSLAQRISGVKSAEGGEAEENRKAEIQNRCTSVNCKIQFTI
jgi:transketolase